MLICHKKYDSTADRNYKWSHLYFTNDYKVISYTRYNEFQLIWGISMERSFYDHLVVQPLGSVFLQSGRYRYMWFTLFRLTGMTGTVYVLLCVTASMYHPRTNPIKDSNLAAYVPEYGDYLVPRVYWFICYVIYTIRRKGPRFGWLIVWS